MKYTTKPRVVDAIQFRYFDRDSQVPKDVVEFLGAGTIAGYDKEQRNLKIYFNFNLRALNVASMEWIVRHKDGRLQIMSNEQFAEYYETSSNGNKE